jgi:hypothetical protein
MAHHAIKTLCPPHRRIFTGVLIVAAGLLIHAVQTYAWLFPAARNRTPLAVLNDTTQTCTNQPALLIFDSASLIVSGMLRADGADIRIADSSDSISLPHWIEPGTINTTNTRLWFGGNTLVSNETTTVYLYYGNPAASSAADMTDTFSAVVTGDAPLVVSWPLDEASGAIATDYSGMNNHAALQNSPERVAGKYRNALRFAATNQALSAPSTDSLNLTSGVTLETWLYAAPPPLPATNDLLLHFDASTLSGLSHNDRVSQWNDLSGNAYHAIQTTNASQPIYQTGAVNSKPAVLFQGAQTLITPLKPGEDDLGSGSTLFVVCSPTQDGFAVGSWGIPRYYFGIWTDELQSGYGDAWVRSGAPLPGSTRLFRLQYDGSEARLYANGTIVHTNPATLTGTNDAAITIGDAHGADRWFGGYIAEIVLYRRSLSAQEVADVEQFLGHKWLAWPAVRTATILGKGTDAYRLEWNLDSGQLQGGINATTISAAAETGRWQHVAFTYDRTNMLLCLDGSAQATGTLSEAISINTSNLVAGRAFPGMLDEIRLYRRALTSGEIAQSAAYYGYATPNQPGDTLFGTAPYYQFTVTRGAAETWSVPDSMPPARNPMRLALDTALYIPFDAGPTVTDRSRHAHSVAAQGTWLAPGRHRLDGAGEYLAVADDPAFDDTATLTLSVWMTLEAFPASTVGIIAKTNAYTLTLQPDGHLALDVAGSDAPILSGTALETNRLYHITAVFDGTIPETQRLRVYLDARLDKTGASTQTAIPRVPTSDLCIGAESSTSPVTLKAVIGPIHLNRQALGRSQISSIEASERHKQEANNP